MIAVKAKVAAGKACAHARRQWRGRRLARSRSRFAAKAKTEIAKAGEGGGGEEGEETKGELQ